MGRPPISLLVWHVVCVPVCACVLVHVCTHEPQLEFVYIVHAKQAGMWASVSKCVATM